MNETTAPKAQLLITEHNITEVVQRIFVKKKDISDPRIVDNLRHLIQSGMDNNDPVKRLAIFVARKEILENASEIYAEKGEDLLFEESVIELNVILEILKEYTITK